MTSSKPPSTGKKIITPIIALWIVIIMLILPACNLEGFLSNLTGDLGVTESLSTNVPGEWYAVYFTSPAGSNDEPDRILADAIDQARLSVDVAIYDFDLRIVRDALLNAHRRGVYVRVVTESDNRDEPEVQALIDSGIPVLGDRREGLMHNKFVIIDRFEVWTGSMNFTFNGAYKNNNNLIRIRSSRLAEDYLVEFEEMFVQDKFGPSSPANTPYSRVTIDGTSVEVYFSPDDGTAARLVDLIESAEESIYFLAYSFTADDIASAMLARANAGVIVSGVFEESQYRSNIGTEFDLFQLNELDVRLDVNPRSMHHKVIIIDSSIVVTGSYNFSASAENSNDENTLIINNPEIAALYMDEFLRIFNETQ